jgi:DNA-binding NarL/FixJ family response regulator
MAIRLLLIDDDRGFVEALKAFLDLDGRFEVVGMAENGRVGMELAASLAPDAVLMDIDMPVMDGVESSRLIHGDQPELPIVLVSASQFEERVADARNAGATGYVQKGRLETDLIETILAVLRGGERADDLLRESLARPGADYGTV